MSTDIQITVIDRLGTSHVHQAPIDMNLNLMEFCKAIDLPVKGECGGMAMCATCQIYIESEHPLNPPTSDELDMLDQAFFVESNSRLGCQIYLEPSLDGLIFRLAPESE